DSPHCLLFIIYFFFTATATTETYTLSLHDALPIYFIHLDPGPIMILQPRVEDAEKYSKARLATMIRDTPVLKSRIAALRAKDGRSEEHTSELQSRENLVCRLLLEKKKKKQIL